MHLVLLKERKKGRILHASSEPIADTLENPNDISISDAETQSANEHVIRLHRIYNFWLFHANIIQLLYNFGKFLYYFLGLTYWSSAQCQFLSVACFFVSQKPNIKRSPNGIKTDGDLFWNIYDFWEVESSRDGARGGHEVGGRAPDPHGHPVRRLDPFFFRKKANIRIEIMLKFQPNRSYGSLGI